MNEKKIMKIMYCLVAAVFIAAVFAAPCSAMEKEEVVYVNMETDGSVEDVYVVNVMNVKAGQEFVDYGDYNSVRNMVTNDAILQDGDKVYGIVSKDVKLYYEGALGPAEIPWDVSIRYFLDGKEMRGEELAGKKGHLDIHLDITQNPLVDKYFYKNYALQTTMSFDGYKCLNIVADGATMANVGSKKQLTFTQMPDKETNVVISMDVIDFEMDAISMNGIRMNMDFDVDLDDTKVDMHELEDAITDLNDAIVAVKSGSASLVNGQMGIEAGITQLANGAGTLNSGMQEINSKVAFLNSNMPVLNSSLQPIIEYSTIVTPEQKAYLKEGLTSLTQGVNTLSSALSTQIVPGTQQLSSGAKTLLINDMQISTGAKKLYDGSVALEAGTNELREKTNGISDKITAKVDEILEPLRGNAKTIPSFTSEKNTGVKSLQFAMHTKAIEKPDEDDLLVAVASSENGTVAFVEEKKEENFFTRLFKLFGL